VSGSHTGADLEGGLPKTPLKSNEKDKKKREKNMKKNTRNEWG